LAVSLDEKRYSQAVESYAYYGHNVPKEGIYRRNPNRIYFLGDFKDGEHISFYWGCEQPSAIAHGNVFYTGQEGLSQLINLKEIDAQ